MALMPYEMTVTLNDPDTISTGERRKQILDNKSKDVARHACKDSMMDMSNVI
jgi:hypothetical protein